MDPITKIGVFDSGLGGLTVLNEICRYTRGLELTYFGDIARVPYGSRTPETITRYARQDMRFLLSQGVQAVVIACGTVSANCLPILRETFALPMLGVIEPSADDALAQSRNKRIGVIGTKATIDSRSYERAIREKCPDAVVFSKACPLFVPLVENGFAPEDPISVMTVERYLAAFRDTGVDTVIMGCTHYPFLVETFRRQMPEVTFIHSGAALSRRLQRELPLGEGTGEDTVRYFFSDEDPGFLDTARNSLDCLHIDATRRICIDEY